MSRNVVIGTITTDDLARILGAAPGVRVRDVRTNHQFDRVEVLLESEGFDAVPPMCEPPAERLDVALNG